MFIAEFTIDGPYIITSLVYFILLLVILSIGLIFAFSKLGTTGKVTLSINGEKEISVDAGQTLLGTLSNNGILLPSACGGGGTCGVCRCRVLEGGGDIGPTEIGHISRGEAKENWRLSCQLKVKGDMVIEVPEEVFGINEWECEVVSNENVATFIKEFVMRLPPGENLNFQSGGYIQIEIPPFEIDYKNFIVEDEYRSDWDKFDAWQFKAVNKETVIRAYSMANHPAEGDIVMLNIRIATPPPDRSHPSGWAQVPPGIATSYIFDQKPGDKCKISGPYGEFYIKDTDKEMIYIGGGAGMAPLRSHIFHLFHTLKTGRKVCYWYGARTRREIFYEDHFRKIEEEFDNFSFHIALDNPLPEDNWEGHKGYIHNVVHDEFLVHHESPEDCEYYLCGPPIMATSVITMLDSLGVDEETSIFKDDFGG
ncbi:MAG: NADH:ubiquinone reductase (Na(+)-transporting) subunit F [Lentisphaeria bacterium]|nr:NADH:ubiquinone reductase (Na(+)-transporting) subunit F [Lentisphaeria bacterium]NQZ66738.1 NADH:ubiquinone reductase (Na(+)-transporting) subunit F [Lentisphaeria bacterium]